MSEQQNSGDAGVAGENPQHSLQSQPGSSASEGGSPGLQNVSNEQVLVQVERLAQKVEELERRNAQLSSENRRQNENDENDLRGSGSVATLAAGMQAMTKEFARHNESQKVAGIVRRVVTSASDNAAKSYNSLKHSLNAASDFAGRVYPVVRELLDAIEIEFKALHGSSERKSLLRALFGELLDDAPVQMATAATFSAAGAFRPMLVKLLKPRVTSKDVIVPKHAARASFTFEEHWLTLRRTALDWRLYKPRLTGLICTAVMSEWDAEWSAVTSPVDFSAIMLDATVADIDDLVKQIGRAHV